jgi:hypothetical protein
MKTKLIYMFSNHLRPILSLVSSGADSWANVATARRSTQILGPKRDTCSATRLLPSHDAHDTR